MDTHEKYEEYLKIVDKSLTESGAVLYDRLVIHSKATRYISELDD